MGTWGLDGGQTWKRQDRATGIRAIHAALDQGINLIDTAPVYGKGYSERVVGEALRDRRSRAVIATKFGLRWEGRQIKKNSSPDSIRYEVEQSLQRLQTNWIDLYQCHWPDPDTPVEEVAAALERLIQEGKIRAAGISNFDQKQIRAFAGKLLPASVQAGLSLVSRQTDDELVGWCGKTGVALLAYSPLGGGVLTGKYSVSRPPGDARGRFYPHFRGAAFKQVLQGIPILEEAASARQLTPSQLAIAWVLAQPAVTAALVGIRNQDQARENAAAADIVLDAPEVTRIQEGFAGVLG
jgi:aryl-alcohol dehydrogenase-like predicted oxidoreductase